jgi:predicted DCC family thiol-disulfide oxidoreductase YuxK
MNTPAGALMLYDGACGLCAASVQFILRHERQHTLRFAALESPLGLAVRARHPELDGIDSMVWVESPDDVARERVSVRADAVLHAARYVGGVWRVALVGHLLPAAFRDAAYDFIARHRHKVFAPPDECYLPPPEVRARFLG